MNLYAVNEFSTFRCAQQYKTGKPLLPHTFLRNMLSCLTSRKGSA